MINRQKENLTEHDGIGSVFVEVRQVRPFSYFTDRDVKNASVDNFLLLRGEKIDFIS